MDLNYGSCNGSCNGLFNNIKDIVEEDFTVDWDSDPTFEDIGLDLADLTEKLEARGYVVKFTSCMTLNEVYY